jgi:hypothetical protein
MHRRKPAELMAKELRAAGDGSKIAFGSAFVQGKLMDLTCERVVPNIAKRLKKFFKQQKVTLNVRVLDADGNLLESDIEDLPPDEVKNDPDDNAEDDGTAGVDVAELRALTARAATLKARIATAPDGLTERLDKALNLAILSLKSGETPRAATALDAIDDALKRSGQATVTDVPPAQDDRDPEEPTPDDGALTKLVERLKLLIPAVLAAPEAQAARLKQFANAANKALKSGDIARAEQLIDAIEGALGAKAKVPPTDESPLSAAAQEARNEIPINVVALGRARWEWISVRRNLKTEIEKLRKSIVATCSGIEGYEDIATDTDLLFDHIAGLDNGLETVLEELVETPEGPKRKTLKDKARQIIGTYEAELGEAFFSDLEQNGFTSVSVREPARTALRAVSNALA